MMLYKHRPKARKDHLCDYCRTTIKTGGHYFRWAYACDGTVRTIKAHVGCDVVAEISSWDDSWDVSGDVVREGLSELTEEEARAVYGPHLSSSQMTQVLCLCWHKDPDA